MQFGNLIEKSLGVGCHRQQYDFVQLNGHQCITNHGVAGSFSCDGMCNPADLRSDFQSLYYPSYCLNVYQMTREAKKKKKEKQVTNASWIRLQIIFGSRNFQMPQIELHPSEKTTEWVTKSPVCSSYVTWCEGRGGLLVSMLQTMSCSSPHAAEVGENTPLHPPKPALVCHGAQFMWAWSYG